MSKHQKKWNPPVASSDDDENATQYLLRAPGTTVPVIEATASELAVPETVEPGAATLHQQPEDGGRMVSVQLDLLRAVIVQLVMIVTETTIASRAALTSPDVPKGRQVSLGPQELSSMGSDGGVDRGLQLRRGAEGMVATERRDAAG
ncbi:unnamed protein product [Lampetra planeri]